MQTAIEVQDLRKIRARWFQDLATVAFVPTMGALHEGHLSLIREAKNRAMKVVVSIFVNPIQFGPKEDFATYPRTLTQDMEKLEAEGVDLVFLPNTGDMYPSSFQTYVTNEKMASVLCGKFRPGHFQGVLTVVSKLFHLVQPDIAVFGKKDYQQFRLISKMVEDLMFPVTIVGGETLRESDGLAMSSRNMRLTKEERGVANHIYSSLEAIPHLFHAGERDAGKLIQIFKTKFDAVPTLKLEYFEIRDQSELGEVCGMIDRPVVMLVAAYLGSVRLIDNLELHA